MDTTEYFSFIKTRIHELQEELKEIQKEKQKCAKVSKKYDGRVSNDKTVQDYKLQIEFINYKIQYLEKLKSLPDYILISNLSNQSLKKFGKLLNLNHCAVELIRSCLTSEEEIRSFLISAYELQQIDYLMTKQNPLDCKEQLLLNADFESLMKLLSSQKKYQELKREREGLKMSVYIPEILRLSKQEECSSYTMQELEKIRENIGRYVDALVKKRKKVQSDYALDVIKEVIYYQKHLEEKLPISFVQFHKEKVLSKFPQLEPMVNAFLFEEQAKGHWFYKIKPKLRMNKKIDMTPFLEAVLAYYQNAETISFFGIGPTNFLNMTESEYQNMIGNIEKVQQERMEEIVTLKHDMMKAENLIEPKIEHYYILELKEKEKFMQLASKVMFPISEKLISQLLENQNLKQYLKNLYCNQELQSLWMILTEPLKEQSTKEALEQEAYQLYKK